jgi:hypothetical protein
MKPFNEMIVVSVTPFSGTDTPDKNGADAVMLQLIAGKMPNRNVLSGTVASRAGIQVGKSYLMNVRENGYDKLFGPDFTFIKIMELESALDVVKASKELGKPEILTVDRPDGFEKEYTRKTTAVEGLRTERILSGDYIPTSRQNYKHETAEVIKQGTSATGETEELFGKKLPESANKSVDESVKS